MKYFRVLYFLLLILALTACVPAFPKESSYYIVSSLEARTSQLVLSPNGQNVISYVDGNYFSIDLVTGEKVDLREQLKLNVLALENADLFSSSVSWSFDGRYLGIPADHYNPSIFPDKEYVFYIFDLQDNTYKRYDVFGRFFSPFNPEHIFTENGVYNTRDGKTTSFSPDFNIRQEGKFRASDLGILWDKNLGVPIAQISTLPPFATEKDDIEVTVESFSWLYNPVPPYRVSTGFVSKRPNQLSGLFFDPNGEYILISEWQCNESLTPCTITPFHADNVYDTVLTLVRWRTQERQELIRLSEIDPGHVVAYGYMAWSADGSTIFISRKDAQPIVIKLK